MPLYGRVKSEWVKAEDLPRGAKPASWRIDERDQHRKRQQKTFQATTKGEALDVWRDFKSTVSQIRRGLRPDTKTEVVGLTFSDFAEKFLRDYGSLRRSVYYADQLTPKGPIMRFFGTLRLREITEADLDRFRAERTRKVSPSTVRKNLIVLGTMFRWAKRWKDIDTNPASDMEKPSEPRHKVRFLTIEEWQCVEEHAAPWLRPILTLAVSTGMRLGEITGLRWDDVDRKAKLIHVPMDSKTGTRAIPINSTAEAVLKGQVRHVKSPFVFVDSTGENYHDREARNTVSKRTKATMKRAGLTDCTFHVLRHTAASWMVQAGRPLAEVKDILGHATMQTTLRYAHLQPEHLRDSMSALDDVIQRAAGER